MACALHDAMDSVAYVRRGALGNVVYAHRGEVDSVVCVRRDALDNVAYARHDAVGSVVYALRNVVYAPRSVVCARNALDNVAYVVLRDVVARNGCRAMDTSLDHRRSRWQPLCTKQESARERENIFSIRLGDAAMKGQANLRKKCNTWHRTYHQFGHFICLLRYLGFTHTKIKNNQNLYKNTNVRDSISLRQ